MIMRAFLPPVRGSECARPRAVDERCPASGRRRGNSPAGGRELSAHGAGTTHGLCPRWECTPHSLFSVLPEKRECAVHGGREKRALWSSRQCTPFLDQTGGNLTRGRMDFFLFPRFAHGRSRLGRILLLFPRKALACAQAQEEGVDGCKLLRFLVADCEVRL